MNKETSLLTAVTVTKPYNDDFLNIWGDSRRTTYYSFWNFIGKDLHYPLQQDVYINGWYQSSYLVTKWQVNPTLDSDTLEIPDSIKTKIGMVAAQTKKAQQYGLDRQAREIAPGVWLLPGYCNSTVIEQPDGIVVIEAAVSSTYGGLLVAKARQLFPGKKIKALVSTSDAWLHIGGVRSFAAVPGISIYHPYRNKFILEKLLHADYHSFPDSFASAGNRNYRLVGVKDSVEIGKGDNRIILYPYHTETGDRQMMVYFPHLQLLYTSDLYQPKSPDGQYFISHTPWEVYRSIIDRKIVVKQFYAMHMASLLPFSDLEHDFKE